MAKGGPFICKTSTQLSHSGSSPLAWQQLLRTNRARAQRSLHIMLCRQGAFPWCSQFSFFLHSTVGIPQRVAGGVAFSFFNIPFAWILSTDFEIQAFQLCHQWSYDGLAFPSVSIMFLLHLKRDKMSHPNMDTMKCICGRTQLFSLWHSPPFWRSLFSVIASCSFTAKLVHPAELLFFPL